MKRILAIFLVTVIMITTINITPQFMQTTFALSGTYYESRDGLWTLEFTDSERCISSYNGQDDCVSIPPAVDQYPVEIIGCEIFKDYNNNNAKSLVLNDYIKKVNNQALSNTDFAVIKMPKNVEFFGEGVFDNCSNLTYVTLPKNLVEVPKNTFRGCSSIVGLAIPETVKTICSNSFEGCTGLKTVIIPESVEAIKQEAFTGCSNLESIVIPATVTEFEIDIFDHLYINQLTIYGEIGSVAEQYASNNNIDFNLIQNYDINCKPKTVPSNNFGVMIYDNKTKLPVDGARVEVDGLGEAVTDDGGGVFFSLPENYSGPYVANIHITKDNYYDSTSEIYVERNKVGRKNLQYNDEKIHVLEFVRVSDGYDLLNKRDTFYCNNPNSTAEGYTVRCSTPNSSDLDYRIIQNEETIVTFTTGTFNIDFSQLTPSEKVFLQVVNTTTGKASSWVETGITIVDNMPILEDSPMSFDRMLSGVVSETVPIFSESSLELGISDSVLMNFEVDKDGQVKIWVGADYASAKQGYQSLFKHSKNALPYKDFPNLEKLNMKSSFDFEIDAYFAAYGEGHIKNGRLWIDEFNGIMGARAEAEQTWVFFVPALAGFPFYGQIEGSLKGEGITRWSSADFHEEHEFVSAPFALGGAVQIGVGLGAGVPGVASVGIEGEAILEYETDLHLQDQEKLDFTVAANVEWTIVFFEGQWNITKTTFHLHDDYNNTLNGETTSEQTNISQFDTNYIKASNTPDNNLVSDYLSTMVMYSSENYSVMQRVEPMESTVVYDDNISVVESNTFKNASPQMIQHNGTPYIFWLADDATRNAQDRTKLVYSKQVNEIWSAPIAIEDDGTADGYFNVTSDDDGIYLLWHDSKAQFPADVSMETFFEQSEINFAYLDTTTDTITIQNVTNNSSMDTAPALSIIDGSGCITWMSNNENNIFFNSGTNTIYKALVTNGSVGNIETIYTTTKPITELNAGYLRSNSHVVVFGVDEDSDLTTIDDRELYFQRYTSAPVNFTNNDVADTNVVFSKIYNSDAMFWYSDSNVKYYNYIIRGTPYKVFGDYKIPTDKFEVITDGYNTKILWNEMVYNNDETNKVVYACDNHNPYSSYLIAWKGPYILTESGSGSTLPTGYFDSDSNLCYLKENGDSMDLVTETITPQAKVEINSVSYADMTPEYNNSELYIKFKNTGGTKLLSHDIKLYRNDELYCNATKDFTVRMGVATSILIGTNNGLSLPLDSTPEDTYRLELTSSDGNTEYCDSYEFNIIFPDIEMELERGFNKDDDLLTIYYTNNVLVDTEGTLLVKENNEEGDVLKRIELGTISNGSTTFTIINLSEIMTRTDANMLYVEVVSSKGDVNICNNNDKVYVRNEFNGKDSFKPIEVSYEATNCTNATANDGSITFTSIYGSGNYQYSIDYGLTWQTSNVFNDLSFGVYEAIIRDFENHSDMFFESISLEPEPLQSVTISNPDIEYYNASNGITLSATSIDAYSDAGTDVTVQYKFHYSTDDGTTWTECADWGAHEITFIPPADGEYIFYVQGQAIGSTATVDSTYSASTTIHLEDISIQSVTITNLDESFYNYNATDGITLSASSVDEDGNPGTDTTVQCKFHYSTDNGSTWTECADWGVHEITFIPPADGEYMFYVQGRAIGSTVIVDSINMTTTGLYFKERPISSIAITDPEPEYYNASDGIILSATSVDGYGNPGTDETVQYMFAYKNVNDTEWTWFSGWGGHEVSCVPPEDGEYWFKVQAMVIENGSVGRGVATQTPTIIHLEEKPIQSVTINNPDAEYYNASSGITLSATSVDGYGNAGIDTTVQYKFHYSTDSGSTWTECADWGSHEITFTPTADGDYMFYVSGKAVGSTVTVDSAQSTTTTLHLGPQP